MARVFELHDRSRFEISAYSYGVNDESEIRKRLEHSFDQFVDTFYKEVFLTSTTKRIMPIVKVNDAVIVTGKPGPVTQRLLIDLKRMES